MFVLQLKHKGADLFRKAGKILGDKKHIYVCMYTCVYMHTHIGMHVYTHMYLCIQVYRGDLQKQVAYQWDLLSHECVKNL